MENNIEAKPETDVVQEAQKTIENAKKERSQNCQKEVEAVLNKYNCSLDGIILITKEGNFPEIRITAN